MRHPLIILMTGVSGSGKSVLSAAIRRHFGQVARVLNVGDLLREELVQKHGIRLTDRNYVGDYYLFYHNITEIASVVCDAVFREFAEHRYKYIVIDGLRHVYNIDAVKKRFSEVIHIHVHVREEELFNRLRRRDHVGSQKYNTKHDTEMVEAEKLADYHVFSMGDNRISLIGNDNNILLYQEICRAVGYNPE